jgi:hypothetical protein
LLKLIKKKFTGEIVNCQVFAKKLCEKNLVSEP